MYHIQNDKRAKTSAELICKGLLTCLEEKPFEKITISDIQRVSSVGRSTFYRLFDSTADVLAYQCDRIFDQIHAPQHTAPPSAGRYISLWMENSTLLQAIVDSGRLDILYGAHRKYLAPFAHIYFPDNRTDPVQMEYLMATLISCTAGILTAWVKCGKRESAAELYARLNECFRLVGQIFEREESA